MRRWIAGIGGAAGLAGLYRLLRRRSGGAPAAEAQDDPAAELRRKLDEARVLESDRDEFEAGETPVDAVDDRRRAVHDRARSAIDEMRGE